MIYLGLIQNYLSNREMKRFNKQEELRIAKEKIKSRNDLEIERIKERQIKLDKQERCNHDYKLINKNLRTDYIFINLSRDYHVYDLICVKCHKEHVNVSEEYKDYLLNKSKVINNK